jgi:tetratricopeptide (TPR) repeat protein
VNVTCNACQHAFETTDTHLAMGGVTCPRCKKPVAAPAPSASGFDDFFEVESSAPTAPPAAAKPAASAPAAPAPATDDGLMEGMGDFDKLFEGEGKLPAPAKPAAPPRPSPPAPAKPAPPVPPKAAGPSDSDLDELLADFNVGETPAPPKASSPPPPPPPKASGKLEGVEELFDFSGREEAPAAKPPLPSAAAKTVAVRDEKSRPDEALEELFSEVSGAEAPAAAEGAPEEDALQAGLGIEYKKRRKGIPKPVVIGAVSLVLLLGLVAAAMARFTPGGFFGWTFGQRPKDGYVPPSGRVLRELNERYLKACEFLTSDANTDYQKAVLEFESILGTDSRNSPTDARLAEIMILSSGNTFTSKERKRVSDLVAQAELYQPGKLETVRAKARMSLLDGELGNAESLARRALTLGAQDLPTMVLLGEIFLARGDLEGAEKRFRQALEIKPGDARAKHFLAVACLEQGKVDEAERLLRELVTMLPPHPSSEIELYRLMYSHRGQVEAARQGLADLIARRSASLDAYSLGRAWRFLAEIAEAKGDLSGAIDAMENSIQADRMSHAGGFYLGRLYLQRKEYEKAAAQFGRANSLYPKAPEYLIYRGNALRELGKLSDSLTDLSKALEKAPSSVEGLFQLGLTQRALQRTDDAIATFESVLKNDPRHLDAMINLGELYLVKDNFGMAKTHLRSAITLSPKSARAHNSLGEVLLITRKRNEALEEFRLAEAEDPQDVGVLTNIGKTYLAMNRLDQAAQYFERALALDSTRVDTQVALGQLQHQRKDYAKAMETYRRVLELRPKDYDTRVKLAQVLVDTESFQEAVNELQEASKWRPNYFPTILNLGIAWRGLGNLDASLEELNRAIQLRPESADAFYQQEMTHIFRNDPVNAEKAMESSISYDATFVEPLTALGDYYDTRNLYSNAAEYYLRAHTTAPANPEITVKLADSYRKDGNMKQAAKFYLDSIRFKGRNPDAYLGLGMIAEEQGQPTKAVGWYRKAQASDPNDARPYYYLGFVYSDLEQRKNAVLAFRKFLSLDPQSQERKDIEDKIYALTH